MKPMKEMMENVANKSSEGPVGKAIAYLNDCVHAAVGRGLFKTVGLWRCVAIIVDHVRVQREALLCASSMVIAFESGDVKDTAAWLAEFKKHAVRARLHQFVQPTEYPKLERDLNPTKQ